MNEAEIDALIERTIRRFRLFGAALLVIGSLMFALALNEALDPTASMRINGVDTSERSAKLKVVAFAAIFPAIGALLTLIPKRTFTPFMRSQFQRVREIQRSIGMK